MNKSRYRAKLIRIQKLINIRISKASPTVSNEALCVITGLLPLNIKIEETGKCNEITKEKGIKYDKEMEVKNWIHPANQVKIIEGREESPHYIQTYTDGSQSDIGVGSGIAIYSQNNPTATLKYRLHGRCSNNQAEQMAILKVLEHIQYLKAGEKTTLVYTDSRITLQMLQNKKKHTRLIELIGTKVIELEKDEWKVAFSLD
jgi:hypothetical protein